MTKAKYVHFITAKMIFNLQERLY